MYKYRSARTQRQQVVRRRTHARAKAWSVASMTALLVATGAGNAYGQPDTTTPSIPNPSTSTSTSTSTPAPQSPSTTNPPVTSTTTTPATPTSPTTATTSACAELAATPPVEEEWTPTPDPSATVIPGQMRSDCQEVPEPFTKADADKAETMEARLTTARVAAGCQVYWPGTVRGMRSYQG